MTKKIYAIYDKTAQDLAGQLMIFAADAAAIRLFGDVANDPQTLIHRHVEEYDLISIGYINTTVPEMDFRQGGHEIIITGAQWLAAQKTSQEAHG